jgi:4-hydroxy-tetrahydrodipicolinate reductase
LKIGLFGFGKTGWAVATAILNNKEHTLEWVVRKTKTLDHRSAPEFLGIPSNEPGLIYSKDDLEEVFGDERLAVDAIIDFSSPDSVYEYADYAKQKKVIVVSAISKYGENEMAKLKELGAHTRVLWSPNITIGINFLIIAAKVLQRIAPYADIEIIEEHFKGKAEVSGTAKIIANHLEKDVGDIKTIRAGGIIGRHEILFGFPYQTVRLSHDSISREAFGNGALFALNSIQSKENGLYTMEDIMQSYFNLVADPA